MSVTRDWFARRAQLNHDLLMNRVLNALQNSPHEEGQQATLLVPYLRLLIARQEELLELLDSATTALAPGRWLLEESPVAGEVPGGQMVMELLDRLFGATSTLAATRCEGVQLLERAMALATDAAGTAGPIPSTHIAELEASVRQLSNLLESLPKSMLGVVETMR